VYGHVHVLLRIEYVALASMHEQFKPYELGTNEFDGHSTQAPFAYSTAVVELQ
jgi:hypothetical protein